MATFRPCHLTFKSTTFSDTRASPTSPICCDFLEGKVFIFAIVSHPSPSLQTPTLCPRYLAKALHVKSAWRCFVLHMFIFESFIFFLSVCVCVCVRGNLCACLCWGMSTWVWVPTETRSPALELQVIVSHPTRVLGIKFGSSGKGVCTLNHWDISLTSLHVSK